MKKVFYIVTICFLIFGCKSKIESIHPSKETITESVYASGNLESINQYQVYPSVNGILNEVFVKEGDFIDLNSKLFSVINESSIINRQNAELNAAFFSDLNSNTSKINDLKLAVDLAKNKYLNDSINYVRQKALFDKNAISESQLEQADLNKQNSKTNYLSSQYKLQDLKKQLLLSDQQSKNNLKLTKNVESDYVIKSDIKGRVYSILKNKGEMVGIQTPIAIIGDAENFVIKLQVDEYDIIKIKKGLKVIVTMDSYKGKTFEAEITKIDPIMNDKSKTFTLEAVFKTKPPVLYPNLSLEANIIVQTKKNTLTIPRKYYIEDQYIVLKDGAQKPIQVGLMDYQKVEIISGISEKDELIIPTK